MNCYKYKPVFIIIHYKIHTKNISTTATTIHQPHLQLHPIIIALLHYLIMSQPALYFTNHTPGRSVRCMIRLNNLDQVDVGIQHDGSLAVDVHHEPLLCVKEEVKNEPIIRVPEIISLIDDEQEDEIPATPPKEFQEEDPVTGELTNDNDSIVSEHTEVDESHFDNTTPPRQFKKARFPDEALKQCRYDMNKEPEKTITPLAVMPPAIMPPAARRIAALTPDERMHLEEALKQYKELQHLLKNPYPAPPEFDMDNMSVLTTQTKIKSAALGHDPNSWNNEDLLMEE